MVHARTDDDLAPDLDAVIEQRPPPTQGFVAHISGCGACRARSSGSVVWMLTFSGESRSSTTRSRSASVKSVQSGEVPVQEAQPVVVVLQVEAAPHALGQLVK